MLKRAMMLVVVGGMVLAWGRPAQAGYIEVFGGPTYDPSTQTGLKDATMPAIEASCVNDAGTAVGQAYKYDAGTSLGFRAVRWDAGGAGATELGNLGTHATGHTNAYAYAVNGANTAVGYAQKYVAGSFLGERAVRWDAGGAAATELGNLGTSGTGVTYALAYAVNDANTAVGCAFKYVAQSYLGQRAVRWDTGGTAATELGNLGTSGTGWTYARANAVNDANTAVGYAEKYVAGSGLGNRAVRWDGGGTAATELGNLGTDSSGYTWALAYAVNDANTAVGSAHKHVAGSDLGKRAVRWDGGGAAATELGNLGTDSTGVTYAWAYAVNDANTAVGSAHKHVAGSYLGQRAVRWDGGGAAATELGNLGTDGTGKTLAYAFAVNDANTAVGCAQKYVAGSNLGKRAVMWGSDGVAVDLNTLIDLAGGWTLTKACAISEHGWWIGGQGLYDPDGPGPLDGYGRLWVMQVPRPGVEVAIDIRPRSDPNSINLLAKGVLPVAILGSEMIDVAEIDQTTLALSGASPLERGKSGNFGAWEDVDGDGFLDLVVRFAIGEVELDPQATEAELTGLLLDGTGIFGTDAVRLVGGKAIDGATLQHTPEPATATIMLIGATALLRMRRKRRA